MSFYSCTGELSYCPLDTWLLLIQGPPCSCRLVWYFNCWDLCCSKHKREGCHCSSVHLGSSSVVQRAYCSCRETVSISGTQNSKSYLPVSLESPWSLFVPMHTTLLTQKHTHIIENKIIHFLTHCWELTQCECSIVYMKLWYIENFKKYSSCGLMIIVFKYHYSL